ncbi:MAG: hypothetical protein M3Z09_12590, partial [Acidobacteriota bacterium]|nr:hypothetical protein [Acidobacteriota bacterium]
MRNISTKLIIGLAIIATGALAADSSLGTWKLNMEKSKFSPSAPVKSLTSVREASDDGVKVSTTGEGADGTAINGGYTAKYDGKDCPATGLPYDTIAIDRIDENTLSVKTKKTGTKYSATGRSVISNHGKTLTTTSKGTNADG